ncbi:MAG: hypothetical protein KatS3mg121_0870 [Gammaproteobacteria bacterium]|nr:MAG: hypothetical protein KatS3mg121_0870 [Gammaproteobacteria bacterium]
MLNLTPRPIKAFHFSWSDVDRETEYRLLEDPDGGSGFTRVASIAAGSTSYDLKVFLPARVNARYILQACNAAGCTNSNAVSVGGRLEQAVGYVKANNIEPYSIFGFSVAVSGDGNTLVVGAPNEDSNATGVNGEQANDAAEDRGAVYVFVRSGGSWRQQAYIKASNPGEDDAFGFGVALSGDGNTLAVGAPNEDSNATGVNGDQANDAAEDSGAVYVFVRSGDSWRQQAYLKASNTEIFDSFGSSVALSGDGNTLTVGAPGEDSNATGVNGDQANDAAEDSGAVYVFVRAGGSWRQQAYLKASNAEAYDLFGGSVALSEDGNTLAVGAESEDSDAIGVNGDQTSNAAWRSGAVYVFVRSGGDWRQQAYIKPSNPTLVGSFGFSVALSADGNTLAVGAHGESGDVGISDGDQVSDGAWGIGAAYVFVRSGDSWRQQAHLKASNPGVEDFFGYRVALSGDGNTLAVGGAKEDSNATGVNGNQTNDEAVDSGAVYVFVRIGDGWRQQAYVKAPNTKAKDEFGYEVALSGDGNALAVGAIGESGNSTGIGGDPSKKTAPSSGAVYLY